MSNSQCCRLDPTWFFSPVMTSRSLNPARLHGCSVFDATVAGRMEVMLRFVGSAGEATSLRITQDGSSDSSDYGYIKWEDMSTLAAVDGVPFAAPATFQPASSSSTAIVTFPDGLSSTAFQAGYLYFVRGASVVAVGTCACASWL